MNNYIYYFYSSLGGTMAGIVLDEALKRAEDESNKVHVVFCDGFLDSCLTNPNSNPGICDLCKVRNNTVMKDPRMQKLNRISIEDYYTVNDYDPEVLNYSTAMELRAKVYRDIPIGFAVFSSYVQLTRNQDPLVNAQSKTYFDTHLKQSMRMVDAFLNMFEKLQPKRVISFNGRFGEVRPFFESAKKLNIPFSLVEMVPEGDETYHKVSFDDCMPHAVKKNLWRYEACWKNSAFKNEEEAEEAGRLFFTRRRKGVFSGDKNIYTGKQKAGLLPADWDSSKRNIVIYNSSEDEFIGVGGEYIDLSLFPTQLDGLKTIFEQFKNDNDIVFYLRIHPNLGKVNYAYHHDLYDFEKAYKNVRVIKPYDPINSYALLEASEKVIVFGSTMGLESVYWGKPVILLCAALYYYSDLTYIPRSKGELFQHLREKLNPKYNQDVLKIGLYLYNKTPLYLEKDRQYRHINYNVAKLGSMNGYHYQKLMGSVRLMTIWTSAAKYFSLKFYKNRLELPK